MRMTYSCWSAHRRMPDLNIVYSRILRSSDCSLNVVILCVQPLPRCEARTGGCQQFLSYIRVHAPDIEKAEYNALGHAGKKEKRLAWWNKKLVATTEEYTSSMTITQVDRAKGKFFTCKKISQKLGDDPAAAIRYCKAAIAKGPDQYYLDGNV